MMLNSLVVRRFIMLIVAVISVTFVPASGVTGAMASQEAQSGPPPNVTSVSPLSTNTAGGIVVTIGGANFTGATAVHFGVSVARFFTVTSAMAISATVPAAQPGSVDVTVTTPSGTSAINPNDMFFYVSPPAQAGGAYHPLTPTRILDTRPQYHIGPFNTPLGPGESRFLKVTGAGGVPPSGVSAVVLNVAVTNTTTAGYLTVYPNGANVPGTSNLNWVAGETVANLVEVGLDANGQVGLYNAAGSTDVVIDVEGWVGLSSEKTTAGLYQPLTPARILDTRLQYKIGPFSTPFGPGESRTIQVTGAGGVPPSGVSAVVLNVTVTDTTAASGYLTVYPNGPNVPAASNLNWVAGETVGNRVIVPVDDSGRIAAYNPTGNTDVVMDVAGWFTNGAGLTTGGRFTGLTPARILDTRPAYQEGPNSTPFGPGETRSVPVTDIGGVPSGGVTAVVLSVAVTNATGAPSSFLTVFPTGVAQPQASDLNFVAGETVPNLVVATVGAQGQVDVHNAAGSVDVIIDVVGYYQ